jgi:hypothetical protein
MLGRGLLCCPALLSGKPVTRALMMEFHRELTDRYRPLIGDYATSGRMKEIWLLMSGTFEQDKKYIRRLQQSKSYGEMEDAVTAMICELPLKPRETYETRSESLPNL